MADGGVARNGSLRNGNGANLTRPPVGAPLRFVSELGDFEGTVLAVEPPSLLEFRWGVDTIRLEVAAADEGSVLTLIDTFDEQARPSSTRRASTPSGTTASCARP